MTSNWIPDTVETEGTSMSVAMGQRKKRVDPFAIFFKAGRPGAGVRKTDDVRPAGGIRQKNTAAGRGKPREGQRRPPRRQVLGQTVSRRGNKAERGKKRRVKKQERGRAHVMEKIRWEN